MANINGAPSKLTRRKRKPAMKDLLLLLIRCYRVLLSPLKGRATCRFYPTCSAYALESVQHHGALRGSAKAARRILKCHPWNPGGYDPVLPEPKPEGEKI